MSELNYDVMVKMVKDVARSASSGYPPYVTAEDVTGHLWVWVFEKKASIQRAMEDGPEWEAKIASTMRKVASDYCAKERASVEGYNVNDLYRYTIPKIKELLPDVFSYTDWHTHKPGRMAELADIKAAVERLPEETRELLYLIHVRHYSTENVADTFGISPDAVRKRLKRALTAVQREVGRRDAALPPRLSGRRTARSNAAAQMSTQRQYEG